MADQHCLCMTLVPPCKTGTRCSVRRRLWDAGCEGRVGGITGQHSQGSPHCSCSHIHPLHYQHLIHGERAMCTELWQSRG